MKSADHQHHWDPSSAPWMCVRNVIATHVILVVDWLTDIAIPRAAGGAKNAKTPSCSKALIQQAYLVSLLWRLCQIVTNRLEGQEALDNNWWRIAFVYLVPFRAHPFLNIFKVLEVQDRTVAITEDTEGHVLTNASGNLGILTTWEGFDVLQLQANYSRWGFLRTVLGKSL